MLQHISTFKERDVLATNKVFTLRGLNLHSCEYESPLYQPNESALIYDNLMCNKL